MDEVLPLRVASEWIDLFGSAGLAAAPINAYRDLADDQQAWANDYIVKTHCPEAKREVELRGLPITLSRTPGRVDALGPELGQDTELMLADAFGYSWDAIGELKAKGAIP